MKVPSWALLIVGLSVAVLLAFLSYELARQRIGGAKGPTRWSYLFVTCILVLGVLSLTVVRNYSAPSDIETKGEVLGAAPWIMVGLMYLSMILGIVAQSYYFLDRSSPAAWLKAILASPIIFIPLLSSYQDTLQNMASVNIAQVMILLVSFQNGFFWKVIFDKQAEQLQSRAGS
jgi:hypothetical protein